VSHWYAILILVDELEIPDNSWHCLGDVPDVYLVFSNASAQFMLAPGSELSHVTLTHILPWKNFIPSIVTKMNICFQLA
jgi:hypothetical protein